MEKVLHTDENLLSYTHLVCILLLPGVINKLERLEEISNSFFIELSELYALMATRVCVIIFVP